MNIAIINNLYGPFARGGAEKIAKMQKSALIDRGHKVISISLKNKNDKQSGESGDYFLNSNFTQLDRVVIFLRFFWHIFDTFNLFKTRQILKILRENQIEYVITHNMTGLGKLSLWFISKKFKHVHVLHDIALLHPSGLLFYKKENLIDSFFAQVYQSICKKFFTAKTRIISPSSWLLEIHKQKDFFAPNDSRVLKNPIVEGDVGEGVTKREDIFIFVGHVSEAKGVDVLFEAWRLFCEESGDSGWSLHIVGDASTKRIEEMKKLKALEYKGRLDQGELTYHYNQSTCLIVPSLCYENSPTVLYEAASHSLFSITSEIGGAKELREYFDFLGFKAGDAEDLKDKMLWVIKNKKTALDSGCNAKKRTKDLFLSSYVTSLEEILRAT